MYNEVGGMITGRYMWPPQKIEPTPSNTGADPINTWPQIDNTCHQEGRPAHGF